MALSDRYRFFQAIATVFVFVSLSNAQWLEFSFPDSLPTGLKTETGALTMSLSSGIGMHDMMDLKSNSRMVTGFTTTQINHELSNGLIPFGFATIAVSGNLSLRGLYTAFRSGNDIVVGTGYGIRVMLNEGSLSPWYVSLTNSHIKGSSFLRLRTTNLGLYHKREVGPVPMILGLDYRVTSSRFSFSSGEKKTFKDSHNKLIVGFILSLGSVSLVPRVSWHPDAWVISADIGFNIY